MKKRLSTPCQHFPLWVLYWTKVLISFTAATAITVKPFQLPPSFLWWSHIHAMAYLEITIILNTCSLHSCEYAQNSRAATTVTSEWILKHYQPTNENVIITKFHTIKALALPARAWRYRQTGFPALRCHLLVLFIKGQTAITAQIKNSPLRSFLYLSIFISGKQDQGNYNMCLTLLF